MTALWRVYISSKQDTISINAFCHWSNNLHPKQLSIATYKQIINWRTGLSDIIFIDENPRCMTWFSRFRSDDWNIQMQMVCAWYMQVKTYMTFVHRAFRWQALLYNVPMITTFYNVLLFHTFSHYVEKSWVKDT